MEARGTTFSPTPTEIIERLLHYSGSSYDNITFADVYSAAPDNLVARHAPPASSGTGTGGGGGGRHGGAPCYYFLSPVHPASATRKSRTVGDGTGRWHTEAGRRLVQENSGVYMSKFSYQEKTSSGTTKPGGWIMAEYVIDGCDDFVFAKIYRSPRLQATTTNVPAPPPPGTASSSTAAVDLVESQQAVLPNNYPDFVINNDNANASQEMVGTPTPPAPPSYMASSSTWSLPELKSFLLSDDDDDAGAPGQV